MEKTEIMVSLGDPKLKEISEVLSNKTCNKILDFLAEKDSTLTDISSHLKVPLNTVEYNVKKLVKASLVKPVSHFWSVKGKKMLTYTVSNKRIVISPRKRFTAKYVSAFLFTGLTALLVRALTVPKEIVEGNFVSEASVAAGSGNKLALRVAEVDKVPELTQEILQANPTTITEVASSTGPWMWFLLGAWFAIVLFMIFSFASEWRNKK